MKRALVTGFEPFDGDSVNPSWEAARRLDGWRGAHVEAVARRLPCSFADLVPALRRALDDTRPEIVIALGLAGGRVDYSIERIAINVCDARIPDNAGAKPIDEPVDEDGPDAYFSTLPIKAILGRLRAAGLPAAVSNTAGTFVCNQTFYALRHLQETTHSRVRRAGFVHVPYLPQQAAKFPGAPSLAVETVVEATKIALEVAATVDGDIRLAAGATH